MKKFLTLALMTVAAITMQAQNIQLHYDFGRNIYPDEEAGRQKVTITLEQFKADKWGSWFYFVDLDMSRKFFRSAYTMMVVWAVTRLVVSSMQHFSVVPIMVTMPTSRRRGLYS